MENYITLVVHTPERAEHLKQLLESQSIHVRLEDVDTPTSSSLHACRVMIPASELAEALPILESGEDYSPVKVEMKMAGIKGNILIPIDFSKSSDLAVRVGFFFAKQMGLHPVLLHSSAVPPFSLQPNIDGTGEEADPEATREAADIMKLAKSEFSKLKKTIRQQQLDGSLPALKFSSILTEGVPEDSILDYCRENNPLLVVMVTRAVSHKGEDMIGSITAEVIDSCRVPVFAIPEDYRFDYNRLAANWLFGCQLDSHDIAVMNVMMESFDFPKNKIYLVPFYEKSTALSQHLNAHSVDELKNYFSALYPKSDFEIKVLPEHKFDEELDSFVKENEIGLMIVPNRKRNIFRRLFRPSIAHRSIFERDLPLLAIPV